MGPEGLVPTLLVYGMLPRLPAANSDFPDQQSRMRALEVARREMETIVAKLRITQAMRSRIHAAANYVITPGDLVRVYRETNNQLNGPYKVVKVEGKQIYIDRDGTMAQHNLSQIVPERIFTGSDQLLLVRNALRSCKPLCNTPHDTTALCNLPSQSCTPVYLTETLSIHDPRQHHPYFIAARKKELADLQRSDT